MSQEKTSFDFYASRGIRFNVYNIISYPSYLFLERHTYTQFMYLLPSIRLFLLYMYDLSWGFFNNVWRVILSNAKLVWGTNFIAINESQGINY